MKQRSPLAMASQYLFTEPEEPSGNERPITAIRDHCSEGPVRVHFDSFDCRRKLSGSEDRMNSVQVRNGPNN